VLRLAMFSASLDVFFASDLFETSDSSFLILSAEAGFTGGTDEV